MAYLLFILISVVALNIPSEAKQEVRKNVHIVESKWTEDPTIPPENLVLICNISEEVPVSWKKDQQWKGNGKELEITVKEPLDAGTYSCWNNDTQELIYSTTIYIMKISSDGEIDESILKDFKEPKDGTFFKCTANNYSGNFKCFWISTTQNSDVDFKVGSQARSKAGNIICDEPKPVENATGLNGEGNEVMYSVSCKKQNNCSLTEEYQPTEMVLEVFRGVVYEKHMHTFFIKEILKPDATECWVDQSGQLTWTPPKTWSIPHSYYGLTYQIKIVGRSQNSCKICEVPNTALHQNGDLLACYNRGCRYGSCFVRSRDRYHKNSAWSNWSEMCGGESHKNDISCVNDHKAKIEPCKCQKN